MNRSIQTLNLLAALVVAIALPSCVANTTVVTAPAGEPAAQAAGRAPTIHSFTANPGNAAQPGQAISFQVVATDPSGAPLQFNWAATGGMLSTTTGQLVVWTPPEAAGTYMVQVIVTNPTGGAASGSQSLVVKPTGTEIQPAAIATPAPAPSASAAPTVITGANLALDGYSFMSLARSKDNGDDVLQRGETVILQPRIKNVGTSKTDDVRVQLTSADPYVDVQSIFQNPTASDGSPANGTDYRSIGPGESVRPYFKENAGFMVAVSPKCPSNHTLVFEAAMRDKYGNSWTAPLSIVIP